MRSIILTPLENVKEQNQNCAIAKGTDREKGEGGHNRNGKEKRWEEERVT